MISRLLPPDEWPRLKGTELEHAWPFFNRETVRVVIVEDGDALVACWALMPVLHVEGLWIAPDHQKRGAAGRRLLATMREQIAACGGSSVVTGAARADVALLVEKQGGRPLPPQYVLSLEREPQDTQALALGKFFHEQIAALMPEETHPHPDERHELEAGLALRTAIEDGWPDHAMQRYNGWAAGAGYPPVTFMGECLGADGARRLVVDIGTSRPLTIDRDYRISLLEDAAVCP